MFKHSQEKKKKKREIKERGENRKISSEELDTSLTMNLSMFENFPIARAPSGFSNATKVCPGVS